VAGTSQSQPKLNADCPLVRQHICIAHLGLVEVFVQAKQLALAIQTRNSALKSYNCDPEPFRQFLPNTPLPIPTPPAAPAITATNAVTNIVTKTP
jgi:hypothetical protein